MFSTWSTFACVCAVVDDLFKVREPQVNAAGVYFVTPTEDSVRRVVQVTTS